VLGGLSIDRARRVVEKAGGVADVFSTVVVVAIWVVVADMLGGERGGGGREPGIKRSGSGGNKSTQWQAQVATRLAEVKV
jgi:hypothetical protein